MDKYSELKKQIQAVYQEHKGRYGYRRITIQLRKQGVRINHKTVFRLMQEMGLKGRKKKRTYRSYKGEIGRVAPNQLNRQFEAARPNQVWLTDVTEIKVNGVKRYLSAFLDVFNREIVGYALAKNPNFDLIHQSFSQAISARKLKKATNNLLIHSDQGWLYQIGRFQRMVETYGMTQSMSRKGNCLDNALMEGFFGILKNECIYQTSFQSVQEAEKAIHDYIRYYNKKRIKEKLDGLSPVEYRKNFEKTAK